jgi:hypothetical protein
MEITVMSGNPEFIKALSEWDPRQFISQAKISFVLDKPCRVSGILETSYQIAADVGIISVPVSIATNLIASWIWSAYKGTNLKETKLRITFSNGEKKIEFEVTGNNEAEIKNILKEALTDVNNLE